MNESPSSIQKEGLSVLHVLTEFSSIQQESASSRTRQPCDQHRTVGKVCTFQKYSYPLPLSSLSYLLFSIYSVSHKYTHILWKSSLSSNSLVFKVINNPSYLVSTLVFKVLSLALWHVILKRTRKALQVRWRAQGGFIPSSRSFH